MVYMTVKEAAKKWGLGTRIVTLYCADNRIDGVIKRGNLWLIPENAWRPADKRRRKNPAPGPSVSDELDRLIAVYAIMPYNNADAVLDTVNEERVRLKLESEIAYLRGDFSKTIACFEKTLGDDAARIWACPAAIAAAISLGAYSIYTEIETYLKEIAQVYKGSSAATCAELALATAAISCSAPNMAPGWLKEGDLSVLTPQVRPFALYLRAKILFVYISSITR